LSREDCEQAHHTRAAGGAAAGRRVSRSVHSDDECVMLLVGLGGAGWGSGLWDSQRLASTFEVLRVRWGEQAVGSNLRETGGEDVLEETGDELVDLEGAAFGLLSAVVSVAERNAAAFIVFETAVDEGDAEDISAEVLQCALTISGVFQVNDPVLVPDLWWSQGEQSGASEAVFEFRAEDGGQRVAWQKEP